MKTAIKTATKTVTKTFALKVTLIASLVLPATALAGQAEIDQIERAASVLNTQKLTQLSQEFNGYDKALGLYRLGLSHNLTGNQDAAKTAMKEAMNTLEELSESQPENAEVKALLAQVYGLSVALEPLKAPYYGIKSGQVLGEAEALAPNNPRVKLVKGIGKLNTPPMFGGSKDAALKAFEQAVELYQNDEYSNYHWGEAETYTWLGLVHQQQGDTTKAKQHWQKALEINPDYGWAKMLMAQ